MSDKTLPPSEQKLKEAREKGNITVSKDLVGLAKLAVLGEVAFSAAPMWPEQFGQMIDSAIQSISRTSQARLDVSAILFSQFALIAIGLSFSAAVLACMVTFLQTGFNIAGKAFESGPEKLNPATNLMNIFSSQKLMMLVIGPIKVTIVLLVCYGFVKGRMHDLLHMYLLTLDQGWAYSVTALRSLFHGALLALFGLGGFDYALQRYMAMKKLRMDLEDVKREHKENEGDPHAKAHRKGVSKELLNEKKSKTAAPRPTAVVVNPQHIAIALAGGTSSGTLPWIVAKASGEGAMRLRHYAAREGIPIIRYVPLARLLYATGRQGAYVPSQTIKAVALVYSAVSELGDTGIYPGDEFEINPELAESMLPTTTLLGSLPIPRK
jgi:type III secretion protein U